MACRAGEARRALTFHVGGPHLAQGEAGELEAVLHVDDGDAVLAAEAADGHGERVVVGARHRGRHLVLVRQARLAGLRRVDADLAEVRCTLPPTA